MILDSRDVEAVSSWLKAHPAVEIVSRDRSLTYAKAVKAGAPAAQEVADRWHLLQNLREVIELVLIHKPAVIRATSTKVTGVE